MGYLLLAIEASVAGWLAIALLSVVTGRLKSVVARGVLDVASWLIVVPPVLFVLAGVAWWFRSNWYFSFHWVLPLIVAGVVFLLGAILIWFCGRRCLAAAPWPGVAEGPGPRGGWSAGRLSLAFGVALLLLCSTFFGIDASIKQHLSEVHTEAETLAISVAPQPVPERDNAAALYIQLGDYFGRNRADAIWPDYWYEAQRATNDLDGEAKPFDFRRADLAEFLARQEGARRMILEAAARPGCCFGRDYSRPSFDMLLPEIEDIGECSRFLVVDARHRSLRGDVDGALADVRAMYGLSSHAAADPWLVCALRGIAIDRGAAASLASVLAANDVGAPALADFYIDPGVSHFERVSRAMKMEEAATLGIFVDLDPWGSVLPPGLFRFRSTELVALFRVFVLPGDLAGYRRYIRQATYPPGRSVKQRRERHMAAEESVNRDRLWPITMAFVPSLSPIWNAAGEGDAARRLARVGLAAYRFRAAKGDFPDRIEQLMPDWLPILPRDPFDGQPLRFRKTDTGCVIYSIGRDLVDNDGTRTPARGTAGDLLFECVVPGKPDAANGDPK